MNPNKLATNQLEQQELSFQCKHPKNYEEAQEHRAALCAGIIKKFIGKDQLIIDAGCGFKLLEKHFKNYHGVDLILGNDIEQNIPRGDVVVFMSVLEHITDIRKTLDNVQADFVYISVPQEKNRMPSRDHVRRVNWQLIKEMTGWEMMGTWMWTLKPKLWRLRYFFPIVSVYAEDEVSLWKCR